MTIGEALVTLRHEKGLSPAELARRAEVPQAVISRLESGHRFGLTFAVACRLADALDVPLDRLRGGAQERATRRLPDDNGV